MIDEAEQALRDGLKDADAGRRLQAAVISSDAERGWASPRLGKERDAA